MTRPVIGIVPSFDEATRLTFTPRAFFLRRDYTNIIRRAGGEPLIITPDMSDHAVLRLCDGIVISGGDDIDPTHYNEPLLDGLESWIHEPDERYEWLARLMPLLDAKGTPLLGICYGMQFLNVYYGGSLYQDIPTQLPGAINHRQVMHEVTFVHNMLGQRAGDTAMVNSRHHQAINRLADGYTVTASASDGTIEAIAGPNHRYGLQWHAEADDSGHGLYRAFVAQCSRDIIETS